jgi:hypothetical protein
MIAIKWLIFSVVYLSGAIVGYRLGKAEWIKLFKKWSTGDRACVLATSLFSWLMVLVEVVLLLLSCSNIDPDKPAKW